MEHNYPRVAARATLFAILALVAGLAWLFFAPDGAEDTANRPPTGVQMEPLSLVTSTGTHKLQVEVARTPKAQALGLMYRTELAADVGMLFVHKRPQEVAMWMKNTYISLDMVFITLDGTVHRIEPRTEPHSETLIRSQGLVNAVLELPGGAAHRYGLKPGDKVRHAFFGSR